MFGRPKGKLVSLVWLRLLALRGHFTTLHAANLAHNEVNPPEDHPTPRGEQLRPGFLLEAEIITEDEDNPLTTSSRPFFQQNGCPYSISEQEADEIFSSTSQPGNVISVEQFGMGRTGNRYESLANALAMGYCCRSRLVYLPQTDSSFPTASGDKFEASQRLFSFSQATLPSNEYMRLRDDPDACSPVWELAKFDTFYLSGFAERLIDCMNDVYMRGCERAFLGPGLDKEIICPKKDPATQTGAGNLVVHIRSGDIMSRRGGKVHYATNKDHRGPFDQPPLQYYLHAMSAKRWDTITVLTWAKDTDRALLNPTYAMIAGMVKTGILGENVRTFKNRTLWEDLREMICADGLVMAQSSMSFPMVALSRASVYVIPFQCGLGKFRRGNRFKARDRYDNSTLLQAEKPNAEVFGIEWEESPDNALFNQWNASECTQRMEMISFDGVNKIKKCD